MALRSSVVLNRLLAKVRLRHLQALVKLAELGSVRRTADAVGLTQPAVSLLLADLERLIEAPLFLRHSRGVTPTPLARDLLPLVRQMLGRLEDGAERVASRLEREEGVIRVVATSAGANGLLAWRLPAFVRAHPRIQVMVIERDGPGLAEAIETGSADVLFCRQPPQAPQGWHFEVCEQDHFVVACGTRHPLARRRRVALDDLKEETWLPNTTGSAARERFERLCEQQRWKPKTSQAITRISVLTWTLLDSHDLLMLVPYSVVRPWVERRQLRVLPLSHTMPFVPLGMLLPDIAIGPATERLARFMRATP